MGVMRRPFRLSRRSGLFAAVLLTTAVVLVSCNGDGSVTLPEDGSRPEATQPPETAPPETAPPETAPPATDPPATDPPTETTSPDTGEETNLTPWLVGLGLLLLIIFVVLIARGSRSSTPVSAAAPPADWRSQARTGYAEARWLQDAMTDDLGLWRGNTRFDESHGIPLDPTSAQATTWAQLAQRIGTASESLYAAEAGAPDPNAAAVASRLVVALNSVRSSLDACADARFGYRTAEEQVTGEDRAQALEQARDREQRAAATLAENRSLLSESMTGLSAII